jgi:hypothetical protein
LRDVLDLPISRRAKMRVFSKNFGLMGNIAILLVVCCCGLPAQGKYGGGTGEPNEPYLIYNAEQMNAIGTDSNDWDRNFKLMAHIDLGKFTGTEYNLIGYYYYQGGWHMLPFTGTFDGNGHSIRNFTYHDRNRDGVGIFGYVGPGSEVKNVYVEDANTAGWYYVGLLVGLNEGTVSNCRAIGVVLGEENVGGLVGMNEINSIIENCSTDVVIEIRNNDYAFAVGGLVGYNFYGTVTNSFANGCIKGSMETYYTGGLAGFHRGGKITNCYADVPASGLWYIGGLIGNNEGDVNSCYSTGDVNCVVNGGGLIGRNKQQVFNCYATGNVYAEEHAGGLIGWDIWGGAKNCYSIGVVRGNQYVGGFVGNEYKDNSIFQSCFWNTDNNPDANGHGAGADPNIIGKTTAEMQTLSMFTDAGWDFVGEIINGPNDIWDICEGTNYPKFVWQIPIGDFICPDGVDFFDFSFFAGHWTEDNCGASNDCDGADLDLLGTVDINDLRIYVDNWLKGF